MTYKILMLVYRNPKLTPSQFKDHYENTHVPLMKTLAGDNFPLSHTRRYIERSRTDEQYAATVLSGTQSDFDYDCISILEFENAEGFGTMSTLLASPKFAIQVGEDCAAFMDAAKTKVVVMGETIESQR